MYTPLKAERGGSGGYLRCDDSGFDMEYAGGEGEDDATGGSKGLCSDIVADIRVGQATQVSGR